VKQSKATQRMNADMLSGHKKESPEKEVRIEAAEGKIKSTMKETNEALQLFASSSGTFSGCTFNINISK